MSFSILKTVPSSAVASGGTIAFTLPAQYSLGMFKLNGGHKLYAEGNQQLFSFPADFTIAYTTGVATVTYNGATPLPAGAAVQLQLEIAGDNDNGGTRKDTTLSALGIVRGARAPVIRVLLGSPAAASATAVLATQARAGTVKNTYTTPVVLDVPRGIAIKSSTTDTTQAVTVFGKDEYGVLMSETLTLNGVTAVNGKKAFKTILADQNNIALAGNLSIGTQAGVLGLPLFLPGGTAAGAGYVLKEIQDGAVATAGTFVGGDMTKATASTGDVRGTWTPNAAPDAAKVFEVVLIDSDNAFLGVPQFTS